MTQMPIAEQFYSVQGEGPYAGTPAVFLRFAGCNLKCGLTETSIDEFEEGMNPEGGATWVCDTIQVWRESAQNPGIPELYEQWEDRGFLSAIDDGAHIILTGGEPTLPKRQTQWQSFYSWLEGHGYEPFVEVETNGTVLPEMNFARTADQFNVSLKLSNSGQPEEQRINEQVIQQYKIFHEEASDAVDAKFKFVVAEEPDMQEVLELKNEYGLPDSMMSLMPAGRNQEELEYTYPEVAELCKRHGWDFSPRLHIDIWDRKTGV